MTTKIAPPFRLWSLRHRMYGGENTFSYDLRFLGGLEFNVMAVPRFKTKDGPRGVWLIGMRSPKGHHYSLVLQRYPSGTGMAEHTDIVGTAKTFLIVLAKAKAGGELYVCGEHKAWLNRRVVSFDAGRTRHGVTPVRDGRRWSLMVQHGRTDEDARRWKRTLYGG